MLAHVVSQVVLQYELLVAYFALEFVDHFVAHVPHLVNFQIANDRKLATAIATTELGFLVDFLVVVQASLRLEIIVADVALKRLLVGVAELVLLQMVSVREAATANLAIEVLHALVTLHVGTNRFLGAELKKKWSN